ncbi:MAG: T9SS type A sorting domain-containing protein [Fibrobacteres bacterium]|nr:T9SS type A sorting domain-containing protein [Fibrobacterota bacterium]
MNKFCLITLIIVVQNFGANSYFAKNGFEPLTDVQFSDSLIGWACGAKGTVLYTVNGGENWQEAQVPQNFFLEKLFFVNKRVGWAVGGISVQEAADYPSEYFIPNTKHAMGALIHTTDGGRTWHEETVAAFYPLPYAKTPAWLFDIDFVDSLRGWAMGSFGSVYRTIDGGNHWEQLAYSTLNRSTDLNSGNWYYAIDFVDTLTGYAAGEDSMIAKTVDGGASWTYLKRPMPLLTTPSTPQPYSEGKRYNFFRALQFPTPATGYALGDNGCLLKTSDSGKTWKQQTLPYVKAIEDLIDIKSVCYINADTGFAVSQAAGELLRTLDGGAHWEKFSTGFTGWFNGVYFTDINNGWITGECGIILHTVDKGVSWKLQHGPSPKNGSLAPILVIHAHGDDETIWATGALAAKYGLNENVPVISLRVTKDTRYKNLYRQGEIKKCELRTAISIDGYAGHRTLDEFDSDNLTTHAAEVQHWGGSEDILMSHLVHAMRIWKPMVVLTHDSVYGEYNKQNHISLGKIATKAFHASRDSSRFSEHISSAGLSAWQPKKLYFFHLGAPTAPSFTLSFGEAVQKTGYTIKQHADRGLLNYLSQEPAGLQVYIDQCSSFVRIASNVSSSDTERDILEGTGYPIQTEKAPIKKTGGIAYCSPNPFNPTTTITFMNNEPALVSITVFDVTGRKIATLLDNAQKPAATHSITWNASCLSSGIYTIKISSGASVQNLRAIILR